MRMEVLRIVRSAGLAVLNGVLPARCLTCDVTVPAPGQLCPACFNATAFVTDPCCARCGQPFAHAGEGGRTMECDGCKAHPPVWRQARAALRYDAQTRRIILPFKHGDQVEIAAGLALQMARAGAALLRQAELLVPVPLHRGRTRARRYNQSALLARAIGRLAGRPAVLDALRRVRATESLQGKSRGERAAAVGGAFAVRAGRHDQVAGRRILLIDDVLTSGATANACALTLLAAGAVQVDLLVAARVPDQMLD